MGLNEYLKCPGLERTLIVMPLELQCPQCGDEVEVWSDEKKRRCTNCGALVYNPNPLINPPEAGAATGEKAGRDSLNELAELAVGLGASAAQVLPAGEVSAEDSLAALCRETKCQNYGLSPTCPPNVAGPAWLREHMKGIDNVIFLKIELPTDVMYSDQRREITKLLHFIVIQVEKAALEKGLTKAKAFAGGSCKRLFCADKAQCRVLYGDGECRNPDSARPSVSGFGINVNRLMKATGWSQGTEAAEDKEGLSTRCGLVLLG